MYEKTKENEWIGNDLKKVIPGRKKEKMSAVKYIMNQLRRVGSISLSTKNIDVTITLHVYTYTSLWLWLDHDLPSLILRKSLKDCITNISGSTETTTYS